MALKEVKYPKKREALLKHYHGEDWTLEDQEQFVRERNDRHTNNWRNRHRDKYNSYMKERQDKWRVEHPYYYGWIQARRKSPTLKYEDYIEYRKHKERKRKMQEKK